MRSNRGACVLMLRLRLAFREPPLFQEGQAMAAHTQPQTDIGLSLVLAVIASSGAPLLLLDGELLVIAASASFCRTFRIDPATVAGRRLFELGAGEWNVPQLHSLLAATAAGHAEIEAYEMDLRRAGQEPRRLVLNAQKLAYDNEDNIRLLLTVADVTDARNAESLRLEMVREKDDLLRDKAVLLQELQHRIANSLQIIASVLLQSARRVQSDETRSHLHEAHQRVMSVAALQRQLSASSLDDVRLRPYFVELCQSIGASMIRDHDKLKLEAFGDDSTARADVSVSLGLIVTELVINALKHAFPDDRGGKINVGYLSHGANWTLSVDDNGIGMPETTDQAKSGLGTSIIKALAGQLHARIEIRDTNPGTSISIIHTETGILAVKSAAAPAVAAI
jgi:two-component sensor histidine kinase